MTLPLTYGQCLRRIMEDNHLSVTALSKKLGLRSSTQLTRILRDEVSPAIITKFHHQFMLIFEWLIPPDDIRALSTSLQYSCLGPESFFTRQAMQQLSFLPFALSPRRSICAPLPPSSRPAAPWRI